jgi:hypothetical protein
MLSLVLYLRLQRVNKKNSGRKNSFFLPYNHMKMAGFFSGFPVSNPGKTDWILKVCGN